MRELKNNFILCPVCGGKTRTKIRPDTRAENLIVFCPKCKRESTVDIQGNDVTIKFDPSERFDIPTTPLDAEVKMMSAYYGMNNRV